ncbi:MAG: biopolymer transporter ExbD [Candidatus Fermentibacteria bacterium]|nr:biopolymer transporter ExbD [Candidatus Fermentibacteria bacterium]
MSAPSKRHVPLLLGSGKSVAVSRSKDRKVTLSLTSMIDMFTILLVFLLKSYSADGQLVTVSDQLVLPKARMETKVELKLEIQVNNSAIVVDGDPVVAVTPELLSSGNSIPVLVTRLRDHLEYSRLSRGTLTDDDMKVNIQGDVGMPAILLQRVMASCSDAGYVGQNLAVIKIIAGEGGDD